MHHTRGTMTTFQDPHYCHDAPPQSFRQVKMKSSDTENN